MTDEEKVADAVRQIVEFALTARSLSGTPLQALNHEISRFAEDNNDVGWVYDAPANTARQGPLTTYRLGVHTLLRAQAAANALLGLGSDTP